MVFSSLTLTIGLCIPDTCSPKIINTMINSVLMESGFDIMVSDICYVDNKIQLEAIDWVAM